jgi:hypothetical protein
LPIFVHDGSGGQIRTDDLLVMSQPRYSFSTPLKGCWWQFGFQAYDASPAPLIVPRYTGWPYPTNTAGDCKTRILGKHPSGEVSENTVKVCICLIPNPHACWLSATRYDLDRHRHWYKASAFTNTIEDCSDGLGLLLSPSTAQYPFGLAHRNLHAS